MHDLWQYALIRPKNNPKPHMIPFTAPLENCNVLQVRVLMYLGVLCSGILESLADVERARKKEAMHQTWLEMLSATNTAFQNGTNRPASLYILTCKVCAFQVLHADILRSQEADNASDVAGMRSATNAAFQDVEDVHSFCPLPVWQGIAPLTESDASKPKDQ